MRTEPYTEDQMMKDHYASIAMFLGDTEPADEAVQAAEAEAAMDLDLVDDGENDCA